MRETMRSRFEPLWRHSRRRLPDSTALGVFRKMRAEGRKGKALSLLQRIRTPFADGAADEAARLRPRVRSVSDVLRERREELDLDLAGIGKTLRIKPAYLAALEQGRWSELPGPAYASGFVRAYANHLGLDPEKVLQRFRAESSDFRARPDLALPVPLALTQNGLVAPKEIPQALTKLVSWSIATPA